MLDVAGPYLFYHMCRNKVNSYTSITLLPLTHAVMKSGMWSVHNRSCLTFIHNCVSFVRLKFLCTLYLQWLLSVVIYYSIWGIVIVLVIPTGGLSFETLKSNWFIIMNVDIHLTCLKLFWYIHSYQTNTTGL